LQVRGPLARSISAKCARRDSTSRTVVTLVVLGVARTMTITGRASPELWRRRLSIVFDGRKSNTRSASVGTEIDRGDPARADLGRHRWRQDGASRLRGLTSQGRLAAAWPVGSTAGSPRPRRHDAQGAGWIDDAGVVMDTFGRLHTLSPKVRAAIAAQDRSDYVEAYERWLEHRAKGHVW
jgi:hypothetical protein